MVGSKLFRDVAHWLLQETEDAESFCLLLGEVTDPGKESDKVKHLASDEDCLRFCRLYWHKLDCEITDEYWHNDWFPDLDESIYEDPRCLA
jgi:hypothetical protein